MNVLSVFGILGIVAVIVVLGVQFLNPLFIDYSIHMQRLRFIEQKDAIIKELIVQGDYACCLKKPCTYCIEKDPKHGVGATCSCLDDVVNARHPCGECIGEIMEGNGNLFLAPYFASALADEMGPQHSEELKQMIEEQYGIPVEEQL